MQTHTFVWLTSVSEYDATPPQVLPCPPHIEPLLTDPGSDMASPVPFQVVAVDDQSGIRESSLSHSLPYSIGENAVSLSAVNNAGVVGYCNFVVTVLGKRSVSYLSLIVACAATREKQTNKSQLFLKNPKPTLQS